MKLVVFDVDGTLTDTSAVDAECFWQAVKEVLGLPANHSPWIKEVKHHTDCGIASQHCEIAFGRAIQRSEIDLVRERLVAQFEAAVLARSECIRPIAGALDALRALHASREFAVAIATGCFRASAELKLCCAGLFEESIPIAGCDETSSREEIMLNAARIIAASHQVDASAITYVGDGAWDVRAARNLGWNFIGIGAGEGAERLLRAGALKVIPGFQPVSTFLELLGEST